MAGGISSIATSPARIQANQANSLLSTGPRTESGKARSRRNALRHGLCSKDLIVRPSEEELFEEMKADFLAETAPQGAF